MAQAPLRRCNHPGCNQLTRESRCPKHAKQRHKQHDKNRPTAAQRGYDGRWQRARKAYLQQHPLCVDCKKRGRVVPAIVVDHIVPHRGDMELFWDVENWQPLCFTCHSRKTARGE